MAPESERAQKMKIKDCAYCGQPIPPLTRSQKIAAMIMNRYEDVQAAGYDAPRFSELVYMIEHCEYLAKLNFPKGKAK